MRPAGRDDQRHRCDDDAARDDRADRTCLSRMSQPRNTATTGSTYAHVETSDVRAVRSSQRYAVNPTRAEHAEVEQADQGGGREPRDVDLPELAREDARDGQATPPRASPSPRRRTGGSGAVALRRPEGSDRPGERRRRRRTASRRGHASPGGPGPRGAGRPWNPATSPSTARVARGTPKNSRSRSAIQSGTSATSSAAMPDGIVFSPLRPRRCRQGSEPSRRWRPSATVRVYAMPSDLRPDRPRVHQRTRDEEPDDADSAGEALVHHADRQVRRAPDHVDRGQRDPDRRDRGPRWRTRGRDIAAGHPARRPSCVRGTLVTTSPARVLCTPSAPPAPLR